MSATAAAVTSPTRSAKRSTIESHDSTARSGASQVAGRLGVFDLLARSSEGIGAPLFKPATMVAATPAYCARRSSRSPRPADSGDAPPPRIRGRRGGQPRTERVALPGDRDRERLVLGLDAVGDRARGAGERGHGLGERGLRGRVARLDRRALGDVAQAEEQAEELIGGLAQHDQAFAPARLSPGRPRRTVASAALAVSSATRTPEGLMTPWPLRPTAATWSA